tara:strand:+ start:3208 stop:5301 length:2094 start_codon:yes stop_codon:yes gene_type:complete
MSVLRFHLMIGPPGSGKSHISKILEPLIKAEIISTDQIRKKLYGDESIQGDWNEIKNVIDNKIDKAITKKQSLIFDSTHSFRPWRLAYTQDLNRSEQIEWIGWMITTEKSICLSWNKKRNKIVPEPIIDEYHAAINNKYFGPIRGEGFATIIKINPAKEKNLEQKLLNEISSTNFKISQGKRNDSSKKLHGYSHLIDFERLLFLIKLLLDFPGFDLENEYSKNKLKGICNPIPKGNIFEKASVLISNIYGVCYADINKLEMDLNWLKSQGFLNLDSNYQEIKPPKANKFRNLEPVGMHTIADELSFIKIMNLIRFIVKNPYGFEKSKFDSLYEYYISNLGMSYMPNEIHSLRKDIQNFINPYGFTDFGSKAKNGYCFGNAILDKSHIKEIYQFLAESSRRLDNPSMIELKNNLEKRLKLSGIQLNETPTKIITNQSIIKKDFVSNISLLNKENSKELDLAINERKKIYIERLKFTASHENKKNSSGQYIWPLQILFHNIGWYLAYETIPVANEKSLIKVLRLDRFSMRAIDNNSSRAVKIHAAKVKQLNKLIEISSGIFFGDDCELQKKFVDNEFEKYREYFVTVRFLVTKNIYMFLREGLQRYPLRQIRMSKPHSDDMWRPPDKTSSVFVLEPLSEGEHLFPIEYDLPPWVVEKTGDRDFKRWLFGFGSEILIESPGYLKQEYIERIIKISRIYKN